MSREVVAAFILSLLTFSSVNVAVAVETQNIQAMQNIAKELRCTACPNQSLLDSDGAIANSIKQQVLMELESGANKEDIINKLRFAYGDYITYNPAKRKDTSILWLGPVILALFLVHLGRKKLC